MSSLTNDLQKIYLTKLQIKEVIGTDSDVFEDYPELISDAISEGGGGSGEGLDWDDVAGYGYIVPAGTYNITQNGTFDISAYASTYVDVPQEGGEAVVGHINITSNGTFIASEYSGDDGQYDGFDVVYVDVPASGITPSGSYSITSNGQYDITTYSYAYVNVPTGGGSGYYYPIHTVSDVTEFINDDDGMPYMWSWMANEVDGESGDMSSAVFTNKYWSYCYPTEFEAMENPVLNFDNFDMGFSMVSYTDLVKREFTYNALPDFNTYKGYTYSYEYANPYYNDENAPEGADTWSEYLTYEFYYGEQLLYSTQLEIVQLSSREIVSPNNFMNGIWRVYDSDNPGLKGYYDETEYGEGNYQNHCWLSIGCLSPAETDDGPVTQFTTTYHAAASYTTGFDPRTLCGYTWNAVVNGNGWLVDLISKDSELLATEMRLVDDSLDIEQAAYLTTETLPSGHYEYTQEIELSDQNTGFEGYFVAALIGDKYYEIGIQGFDPTRMYDEHNVIPATGTLSDQANIGNPNLYVDMSDINNYYSTWSMTLTLHIQDDFYKTVSCYWTWSFSGSPILNITDVYSQGTSSQAHFTDMGDGTWLEADVRDALYPGRVIYEVYDNGTSQAYQVSSWDSTNEVLQFVPGDQRDFTQYGESGWDWLWDTEAKTLSHVSQ